MAELHYRNTDGKTYTYADQNELYKALNNAGMSGFSWFHFSGGDNRIAMLPGEGSGVNVESYGAKFHLANLTSKTGLEINVIDGSETDGVNAIRYDQDEGSFLKLEYEIVKTTVPESGECEHFTVSHASYMTVCKTGDGHADPFFTVDVGKATLGSSFLSSGSISSPFSFISATCKTSCWSSADKNGNRASYCDSSTIYSSGMQTTGVSYTASFYNATVEIEPRNMLYNSWKFSRNLCSSTCIKTFPICGTIQSTLI